MLLVLEIAVTCNEDVEPLVFHERKEAAILHSWPAYPLDRRSKVPRQCSAEPPVKALVHKDTHHLDVLENAKLASFNDGENLLPLN